MTKTWENLTEFTIKNGKLIDSDYNYDCHIFFNDRVLDCYVLIPGIAKETLLVTMKEDKVIINANIKKEYFQIFKSKNMLISLNLPEKVRENILTAQYHEGVLHLEFVRFSSS